VREGKNGWGIHEEEREYQNLPHNHTEDYYLGKREWEYPKIEPVRSAGFL